MKIFRCVLYLLFVKTYTVGVKSLRLTFQLMLMDRLQLNPTQSHKVDPKVESILEVFSTYHPL